MFSAPTPPVTEVQHAATMAPRIDASLEIGTFPLLTIGPIMTNDQHELFSMFLKLKPQSSRVLNLRMPTIFWLTVMSYYTRWV